MKQLKHHNTLVHYEMEGEGPCVVLLHGFLEDHSIWDSLLPLLARHYQMITIDLPGFGQSPCIASQDGMYTMAEIVRQILLAENIKKCMMVGHSMGGYVALAFAEKHAHLLAGLVLFHSQAAADSEEARLNRNRVIEAVKQNHTQFIRAFIPLMFAEKQLHRYEKEIEDLRKTAASIPAESIISALSAMRDRSDQLHTLTKLDIPVLFIIGKQDSRIPLDLVLPQIKLPKHGEALILEDVGHMGFIEAKKQTEGILLQFANRIYQP